jgi:hypothetical protein
LVQVPSPFRQPPLEGPPRFAGQQHDPKKPYTVPLKLYWLPLGTPYGPSAFPRLVLKLMLKRPDPAVTEMSVIVSFGWKKTLSKGGSLASVAPLEATVPSVYLVCPTPSAGDL